LIVEPPSYSAVQRHAQNKYAGGPSKPEPECGAEKFVHERKKKLVGKVKTKDGLPVTRPSGLRMGTITKVATTTR
jgi:hypothetical protein